MTTKWTIRKYAVSALGNEVALPWMLFQPGVIPPKTFHEAYWAACSMGETFDEVLAYVDSQTCKARIVEVDLPKVERKAYIDDDPFSELIIVERLEYGAQVAIRDGSVEQIFRLSGANLKPLAEYLLALHYEKENDELG